TTRASCEIVKTRTPRGTTRTRRRPPPTSPERWLSGRASRSWPDLVAGRLARPGIVFCGRHQRISEFLDRRKVDPWQLHLLQSDHDFDREKSRTNPLDEIDQRTVVLFRDTYVQ